MRPSPGLEEGWREAGALARTETEGGWPRMQRSDGKTGWAGMPWWPPACRPLWNEDSDGRSMPRMTP